MGEPRLEIDHLYRHPSRSGVLNQLQVVAPPQLLSVIEADPRSIPTRSLQRGMNLSRVALAQQQVKRTLQRLSQLNPQGQQSRAAGIADHPGLGVSLSVLREQGLEALAGMARGWLLKPSLRKGLDGLPGRPPALQINQQPILDGHQLLSAAGIHHRQAQTSQQVAKQRQTTARHPHHQNQRRLRQCPRGR